MRKQSWVAVLVAAALCLAFAAPALAKSPVRPFGGWTVGADTGDPAKPGCPADAFIRYGSVGQGQMLHLGHVHVVVTQCTWLNMATGSGSFDLGTITITAANGDVLNLAQKGTFTLAPSSIQMTWTVAPGGTGRFAQATGSGTGQGFSVGAGTPESTTSIWLTGRISY